MGHRSDTFWSDNLRTPDSPVFHLPWFRRNSTRFADDFLFRQQAYPVEAAADLRPATGTGRAAFGTDSEDDAARGSKDDRTVLPRAGGATGRGADRGDPR